MSRSYKGTKIRSKNTQRVFEVVEQRGIQPELKVQLVSSPIEEHPSVHEPFWLEHSDWEEVT